DFSGRDRTNEYDPAGRLLATTIAEETTRYEWDGCGTLSRLSLADGSAVAFEYDLMGRVVAAENASCKLQIERDPVGRITREVRGEHAVSSTFTKLGDRSHRTTSAGGSTGYEYDTDQNLIALTLDDRTRVRFIRDALNREVARHFPNGTQLQQSFDAM